MESRKSGAVLDRLIFGGVVTLAVLTPVVFSSYAHVIKATFVQLVVTLILGVWLIKVLAFEQVSKPRCLLLIPMAAVLIVSVLSLTQAINLEAGLREIYRLSIYIMLYVVVVGSLLEKDRWRMLAGSMLLGGVLTCLAGFYQFFQPGPLVLWTTGEVIGSIGNRIYFGAYLLTLIPLAIALYLLSDSRVQRVTWGVVLAVLNVSIVLTRSRGAWLGLAIGLCVMAVLMQRHTAFHRPSSWPSKAKELLTVVAILVCSWGAGFLLFGQGEPSQTALLEASGDVASGLRRLSFWWDSLNMIRDNPWLGIGTGNFTYVFFRYADVPQGPHTQNILLEHPHNEYIHMAVELGAVGVLVFLWLLVRVVGIGWQGLTKTTEGRGQPLRLVGLFGCLGAMAMNAVVFYPFHEPSTTLNLVLILGLLEVTSQRDPKETTTVSRRIAPRRLIGRGAGGLIIFGTCAALFYSLSFRPFLATYYFGRGGRHFAQGKFKEAIRDAERSLAWDERSFNPRYVVAQNHFRKRRFAEAIHESEKLLQLHPYILYPFDMIATSYMALGEKSKAIAAYERALTVNPRMTTALVNLGGLYMEQKEYNKAKPLLERAIRTAPEKPQAYANLGHLHRELGQFEEALASYREAVRRDPSLSHAWYAIAALEAQAGRIPEALQALARSFSLNTALRDQARTDPAFDEIRSDERFRRIVGR